MARYVLISFQTDAEAEAFVAKWNEGKPADSFSFIRAMFQKPTLFCDCESVGKGSAGGYTRGKKYGWWVHSKCGKPSRAWAGGHGWFASLGKNLLPKSDNAPEYRGDGVWANKWDPEQRVWVWDAEVQEKQVTGQQNIDVSLTPEGVTSGDSSPV